MKKNPIFVPWLRVSIEKATEKIFWYKCYISVMHDWMGFSFLVFFFLQKNWLLIQVEIAFGTLLTIQSFHCYWEQCYFKGLWTGLRAKLLDSISQYYLGAVTIPPSHEELSACASDNNEGDTGSIFIHFYTLTPLNIFLPSYTVAYSVFLLYTATPAGQRSMLTFSWQQTISPREHNMREDSCYLLRYNSSDQRASCPWS